MSPSRHLPPASLTRPCVCTLLHDACWCRALLRAFHAYIIFLWELTVTAWTNGEWFSSDLGVKWACIVPGGLLWLSSAAFRVEAPGVAFLRRCVSLKAGEPQPLCRMDGRTSSTRLLLSFLGCTVWFQIVLLVPLKVPTQLVPAAGAGLWYLCIK